MEVPEQNSTWLSKCYTSNISAYSCKGNNTRCCAIFYGRTVAASLSILGCCLVLFMILVYRKYRHFTHRMIMYLIVPSIIISVVFVNPYRLKDDSPYCQISGFLINTCTFTQRIQILCIVIHLLVFTVKERRPKYIEHVFVSVFCCVPPLISSVPFIGKDSHYGYAGDWCWIKGGSKYENFLRFFCMYFWMLLFVMVEFVCFCIVIIKVRKHIKYIEAVGINGTEDKASVKRYKKQIYPLLCYPLVNMLLAVLTTSNRVQNWMYPDEPVFVLYLLHSIIHPFWGFCNAMMYFVSRDTLREFNPSSIWEQLHSRRNTRTSQQHLVAAPTERGTEPSAYFSAVTNPVSGTVDDLETSDME